MKNIFTTIALFIVTIGFSQTTIDKSGIDSGGGLVTNGAISMLYTIGEAVVQETSVGSISISEGFINPNTLTTLGIENNALLEGLQIFPNPTSEFITINFPEIDSYEITIFNTTGQKVGFFEANQVKQKAFNVANYKAGIYMIVISNPTKKSSKVYKIIKK